MSEALGEFEIRAYDDGEIARPASMDDTGDAPVLDRHGRSLDICLQEIGVPPMAKRPMHLDIVTPDRQTQRCSPDFPRCVDRPGVETYELMREPESNDFCRTDLTSFQAGLKELEPLPDAQGSWVGARDFSCDDRVLEDGA